MKQEKLDNKYGSSSFENSNKTLFYVAVFFEIALLIASSIFSYHFYLGLFKDLGFRETIATALTCLQSVALYFLWSYVWTQYFRKSKTHIIERFNGVFIIALVVFGVGIYADLAGVKELPELLISDVERTELTALQKQHNLDVKSYNNELARLDKIIAQNRNWNNVLPTSGKWSKHNKWKKASEARIKLLDKKEANNIAYNEQRAKETDLFLLAKHKRESKVKSSQTSFRYGATFCIILIVVIGFFKELYQYNVWRERSFSTVQNTVRQTFNQKVEDLEHSVNTGRSFKTGFQEIDFSKDVEKRAKESNKVDALILELLAESNFSYREIAKSVTQQTGQKVSHSKVGQINSEFKIRKNG